MNQELNNRHPGGKDYKRNVTQVFGSDTIGVSTFSSKPIILEANNLARSSARRDNVNQLSINEAKLRS